VDEDTTIKGEINNLVQVFEQPYIQFYRVLQRKGRKNRPVSKQKWPGIGNSCKRLWMRHTGKCKEETSERNDNDQGKKTETGLGLYMSHSTIKGKFGGTMKVKSEEGKGTEICILIPFAAKT